MTLVVVPPLPRSTSVILTATKQGRNSSWPVKECTAANLYTVEKKLPLMLAMLCPLELCLRVPLFATLRRKLVTVAELPVDLETMLRSLLTTPKLRKLG